MFLASPISFPNLGITVDPNPVAFTVFGKDIYWYGIIIALGFLLAVALTALMDSMFRERLYALAGKGLRRHAGRCAR